MSGAAARSLSLTVTCPDWCDKSPRRHLEDGRLYHEHSLDAITTVDEGEICNVGVRIERYDSVTDNGDVVLGSPLLRIGDDVFDAEALELLSSLLKAAKVMLDAAKHLGTTRQPPPCRRGCLLSVP